MKYIHPDIVVGEAIPEVEPRVNAEALEYALKAIRFCRWASSFLFVLVVMFTVFDVSWGVRLGTIGVLFVGFMGWALRPARKEIRKKQWKNKQDYWSIPLRVNMKFQGYSVLMMVLIQMSFMTGDGSSGAISFIGIMALVVGGGLAFGSRHIRQPGQISCVDCEYPLVGLTLPCACPECGRSLVDGSSTTDRPRVGSGWFVPSGVLIALVGGLMFYASYARPGLFYGAMPRGVLVHSAMDDRGAFDHLIGLTMSVEQTDDLIESVIARNADDDAWSWGFGATAQGRWVSQFAGSGRFTPDQYARVYGRLVGSIRIKQYLTEHKGAARVGEAMEVGLVSERVRVPDTGLTIRYFLRGFEVGDNPELVGGGTKERYLGFLDSEYSQASYKYVPRVTLTPSEAGELVVRARVVVALLPAQRTTHVRWGDGGFEGFFDKDGMSGAGIEPLWWELVDLEYVIEVKR